jgi:hypothetical protein
MPAVSRILDNFSRLVEFIFVDLFIVWCAVSGWSRVAKFSGTYAHHLLNKLRECFVTIVVILVGGFPFATNYACFSRNCLIGWCLL